MPIVEVRALPQAEGIDVTAVLKLICCELANLLGEPPHGVWGTWNTLLPERYVEGDDAPDLQPRDTHPPIVTLMAMAGRPAALVESLLERTAHLLARELQLDPGNVFVHHLELQPGHVYSGGRIVR